jgi:hypothetical protein
MFYNGYTRVSFVFHTYDASVSTISDVCCKSRSSVAHVAVDPICSIRLLQLLGPHACAWVWMGRERQVRETMQAQIQTEAGMGYGAGRDTERHRPRREVGMQRGRSDASPRPDVRTLAFPTSKSVLLHTKLCPHLLQLAYKFYFIQSNK